MDSEHALAKLQKAMKEYVDTCQLRGFYLAQQLATLRPEVEEVVLRLLRTDDASELIAQDQAHNARALLGALCPPELHRSIMMRLEHAGRLAKWAECLAPRLLTAPISSSTSTTSTAAPGVRSAPTSAINLFHSQLMQRQARLNLQDILATLTAAAPTKKNP